MGFIQQQRRDTPGKRAYCGADKETGNRLRRVEFDGGTVEANREDNRLQIFFEEKPDEKTRETLKESGFRWSPKAGAWQRQLNDNAIYAADRLSCIQPPFREKPRRDTERSPHSRQDREKALYPGAACTGQGSVESRPEKGSGKDQKAGLRKELNHAEI